MLKITEHVLCAAFIPAMLIRLGLLAEALQAIDRFLGSEVTDFPDVDHIQASGVKFRGWLGIEGRAGSCRRHGIFSVFLCGIDLLWVVDECMVNS
jgi:hypothetical protein